MKLRILLLALFLILLPFLPTPARAQTDDPTPPSAPVKLIFIHHSTGENWLTDDYGNLGRELAANNYFVSDTNYGWGPDAIGDRTDIVNWREWFTGPESPRYLNALFNESAQHASYTRTFDDPGGENQIILFKSCFPNSALEGHPNDPPDPNEGYTVGHAKYVYNELLTTFLTRPDKLFIVITSPPLQDPTYAANARAFDDWLLNDWLTENAYPYPNVAVFDFHAVLSASDNHHRYANGQIERVTEHGNTLVYDSDGDDHPNPEGSQKATAEFIPLLNLFYHRWQEAAPVVPLPTEDTAPAEPTQPPAEENIPSLDEPPADTGSLIDNFDGSPLPETDGWQAFWDESTPTTFTCAPENGALHLTFDVAANSWATCAMFYYSPRDGRAYQGITFRYQADAPARLFDITVNGGTVESPTNYQFTIESIPDSVGTWVPVALTWEQLLGVDWEADSGNPIDPAQITGFSIGFSTYPDTPNQGELWMDDLGWLGAETPPADEPLPTAATPPEVVAPTETPAPSGGRGCPGTITLGAFVFAGVIWKKTRRRGTSAE